MENNKEKALSDFINEPEIQEDDNVKEIVLNEREGLIERYDKKILVNKDGKQLLREQY